MKSKLKPYLAIGILITLTVGASLAAFIWLSTIEKQIEYSDIVITDVLYNRASHEFTLKLLNGLNSDVLVKGKGSPSQQTVITVYPTGESEKDIDCTFVSLAELDCTGSCDTTIKPDEQAELTFGESREKCILPTDTSKYHVSVFFGLRAPISKEFSI